MFFFVFTMFFLSLGAFTLSLGYLIQGGGRVETCGRGDRVELAKIEGHRSSQSRATT